MHLLLQHKLLNHIYISQLLRPFHLPTTASQMADPPVGAIALPLDSRFSFDQYSFDSILCYRPDNQRKPTNDSSFQWPSLINATRSFRLVPVASGSSSSFSARAFCLLIQKVGNPNHFAPAISQPAN